MAGNAGAEFPGVWDWEATPSAILGCETCAITGRASKIKIKHRNNAEPRNIRDILCSLFKSTLIQISVLFFELEIVEAQQNKAGRIFLFLELPRPHQSPSRSPFRFFKR